MFLPPALPISLLILVKFAMQVGGSQLSCRLAMECASHISCMTPMFVGTGVELL